jgi:hypothetical protein
MDDTTDLEDVMKAYADSLGERKKQIEGWLEEQLGHARRVPGAQHTESYMAQPLLYPVRVLTLFERYLPRGVDVDAH